MEPFTHAHVRPPFEELQTLLRLCTIFSPNMVEAESLVGPGLPHQVRLHEQSWSNSVSRLRCDAMDMHSAGCSSSSVSKMWGCRAQAVASPHPSRVPDVQLVGRLHDLGAQLVSLRCGTDGALVSQRDGGAWAVPAVPETKVVDPTGCGNAFCGGFLAALQAGEPLEAAAQWGCVAASFLANCQAVPDCAPSELRLLAAERLQSLKFLTRHVTL